MSTSTISSDIPNISKLTSSKGFDLWSIYIKELLRKDGVIFSLIKDIRSGEGIKEDKNSPFKREDMKARPDIVLKLG